MNFKTFIFFDNKKKPILISLKNPCYVFYFELNVKQFSNIECLIFLYMYFIQNKWLYHSEIIMILNALHWYDMLDRC